MAKLPKKIVLTAMKKQWKVSYVKIPGKLIIVEHPHHRLTLYGNKYSKIAALTLITRWVRLKAHDHLIKLVKKTNRRMGVKYKKIIVRSHVAQWGSYSVNKTISLNYKLIFLPPVLVKHLIIHELCHMKDWRHSDKFWQEVEKFDKNWKKNKAALDEGDDYIPDWVIF